MLAKKHNNVKMKERNIRTSYPICWAVMQAAKEVERCWFSAQGDAVGENKRIRFFGKSDAIVER